MSIVLMTTTKNQYCKKNNGLLDFGLRHLVKFHYWTYVDFNAIYFCRNKYQNVVGNYDRINHSQQKKFLRCSLFQYHLNVIYHRQTTDKWSHLSQTPDNQTPTCPTFHHPDMWHSQGGKTSLQVWCKQKLCLAWTIMYSGV